MREVVLAAVLFVFVPSLAQSQDPAPTWEAYDAAVQRAWAAKFAGRFEEGLAESRLALDTLLQLDDAPAYKIHGTRADVRIHEEIVALPVEGQREIHAADEMAQPIRTALRRREFAKAESLTNAQIEIRTRLLGPGAYDIAESLRFLARCLEVRTEWSRADSLFLVATDIYDDYLGERHPNLATILADRAANAQAAGRRGDAERLLTEGLTLLQERGWANHPLYPIYAYSLMNLSTILRGQGELARAETAARQALAILDGHADPQERTAQAYASLGRALYEQGRFDEAEGPLRTVLEKEIVRLGKRDPDIARARVDLATNLSAMGRWEEAEFEMRSALALRDSLFGASDELPAKTRIGLATLLADQSRSEEAETLYGEAESLYRDALRVLGDDPDALASWGDFLRERGRFEEAERVHRRAVDEYRRREDPLFRRDLPRHLRALGADLYALGRVDDARTILDEAAVQFEKARVAAGDRFERATFEASPYPLLAATCLAAGDSVAAWEAAERSQGRALLDILGSGQRRLPPEVDAKRLALSRALDEAERRWELATLAADEGADEAANDHAATGAVAAAAADGARDARERANAGAGEGVSDARDRPNPDRDAIRRNFLRAQAAWVEFQEDVRERFPYPGEAALGLADLTSHLDPEDAVLGWLDLTIDGMTPQAWVYVVRRDGVRWFPHPALGDAAKWDAAETGARELYDSLHEESWSSLGVHDANDTLFERVFDDRWAPALPALDGVERIVVTSTGALDGIPIDALRTSGHQVVDRWTITTAPSASVHVWLSERARGPRHLPESLFAVADPEFEPSPLEGVPWRLGTLEPLSRGAEPGFVGASSITRARWAAVPASREEVRAIARFFKHADIVVGAEASEATLAARLAQGELASADVLHFATHAFADDRRPDHSALVLAPGRSRSARSSASSGHPSASSGPSSATSSLASAAGSARPTNSLSSSLPASDGLLTAREVIEEWQLDSDLVVLSACQTALGRRIRGEGFVGLTQSFLLAGSRNVLATLWDVDDEATRLLMEEFYQRWMTGGESAPDALRGAKRRLRDYEVDGRTPFSHPRHWAAFVWVGPGEL